MNKVILIGRLTKDIELKTTANGVSVCSFAVAVNRRFKNSDGSYDADFVSCVAWRQQAEFLAKYFSKGASVGIVGSIQTRNYENNGQKVYVTEVNVDEVYFVGNKTERNTQAQNSDNLPNDGFIPVPGEGDDLPF